MTEERKYWFPCKTYGWGWGLPTMWQGWVVLAGFVVLIIVGTILFPPATEEVFFFSYVSVLCGLLLVICWLKGEPPGWRSGKE